MYSVTIFNRTGKPMIQLPLVHPPVANHWCSIAIEKGYECKVEYVGGSEPDVNHRIASNQDLTLYS
jgi:hypothetical protein